MYHSATEAAVNILNSSVKLQNTWIKFTEMETTIGARIKELRKAKKWSVETLADSLGLQATAIYNIERGDNKPSFDTIAGLGRAFSDLNLEWLVHGTGAMLRSALPGGTVNSSGGTSRKKGTRPHIDFTEANVHIEQSHNSGMPATQTDAEFRDMLIARIAELKNQIARMEAQLEAKDQDHRKTHRVLERLQDSYAIQEAELQELRLELRGKETGNHLAPGQPTEIPSTSPIGFKPVVRQMWELATGPEAEEMAA